MSNIVILIWIYTDLKLTKNKTKQKKWFHESIIFQKRKKCAERMNA